MHSTNGSSAQAAEKAHLNLGGFEVFAEDVLQGGDGRLHRLLIAELGVSLEALFKEIVRLLILRASARALPMIDFRLLNNVHM